jgi:glutaredoxin 3
MKKVRMYSTRVCPFCVMAKRLLQNKGVHFDEIRVDEDHDQRDEMVRVTGRRTVPQIFVGDTHVGGFDDLSALERAGELDPLLKE